MDTARLWLLALLILAPVVFYAAGVVIYNTRRRARRETGRPSPADISARIEAEHKAREETEKLEQGEEDESPPLPPGWHWPTRERE
ncbi:hypothetical protein AB5J62_05320 [Amycolatopsis sp. cg5]|uniref:hypothetical protein n=1 Tax=Amycolatopsis sp. cg5 TaxID=3238802 RepID=UPI00352592B0